MNQLTVKAPLLSVAGTPLMLEGVPGGLQPNGYGITGDIAVINMRRKIDAITDTKLIAAIRFITETITGVGSDSRGGPTTRAYLLLYPVLVVSPRISPGEGKIAVARARGRSAEVVTGSNRHRLGAGVTATGSPLQARTR